MFTMNFYKNDFSSRNILSNKKSNSTGVLFAFSAIVLTTVFVFVADNLISKYEKEKKKK